MQVPRNRPDRPRRGCQHHNDRLKDQLWEGNLRRRWLPLLLNRCSSNSRNPRLRWKRFWDWRRRGGNWIIWNQMHRFISLRLPSQLYLGIQIANNSWFRDPEMSNFFLKEVLAARTESDREKLRESYRQRSPLAELLYSRWIEGLRERWPAIWRMIFFWWST